MALPGWGCGLVVVLGRCGGGSACGRIGWQNPFGISTHWQSESRARHVVVINLSWQISALSGSRRGVWRQACQRPKFRFGDKSRLGSRAKACLFAHRFGAALSSLGTVLAQSHMVVVAVQVGFATRTGPLPFSAPGGCLRPKTVWRSGKSSLAGKAGSGNRRGAELRAPAKAWGGAITCLRRLAWLQNSLRSLVPWRLLWRLPPAMPTLWPRGTKPMPPGHVCA
jgi:hypothetical protein